MWRHSRGAAAYKQQLERLVVDRAAARREEALDAAAADHLAQLGIRRTLVEGLEDLAELVKADFAVAVAIEQVEGGLHTALVHRHGAQEFG